MSIGLRVRYLLFLFHFNESCLFEIFSRYPQIQNFVKICPVAAEFYADRWRDRHDEANCRLL